eukprot:4162029-Pleurochrysis_carterae.AAC.1
MEIVAKSRTRSHEHGDPLVYRVVFVRDARVSYHAVGYFILFTLIERYLNVWIISDIGRMRVL